MKRVKFKNGESQRDDPSEEGPQRRFLKQVLENTNCPSLRAFLQFGFDRPYSTLKNYYSEKRLLPEEFFKELAQFGKINLNDFEIQFVDDNWGQVLGGKKSKRKN